MKGRARARNGRAKAGMAGLVAPMLNWEFFEANWKAALNRFDLPFFHMKDFAQFRGAFQRWTSAIFFCSESGGINIGNLGKSINGIRSTVLP